MTPRVLLPRGVGPQALEQRIRFLDSEVVDVSVGAAAEIQRIVSCLCVRAHDRVTRAWRIAHEHVRYSLVTGFYQGWDLHPAQLPVRYGAVFSFFLEGLDAAGARLRAFLDKAAQATLLGDVFDDAATGQ